MRQGQLAGGPGAGAAPRPLEVWAGVECTVNRVGDDYFDQLARSGHADRADDLDRLAALGVRAVRYPVLWERVAPHGLRRADWSWTDRRLARLRELGVRPIVGLVHHGSGPRDTSLLDPAFPARLAEFAAAAARRYPWVEEWTPVNEPLTTARFSALYGLWYPHLHSEAACMRALLAQCEGVARAMAAIREVIPGARLVQTEDLGMTHATPRLAYQAAFENERRWLSFDLLCGRVQAGHPLHGHLRWLGIADRELAPLAERPCPPDVLGVNHYLTSERFLDERLERYPHASHGGNGRDRYADVEAVRVCAEGPAGPLALLEQAWARFRLPIAVTECHLGCTREQQLRWLDEVWSAAHAARARGVDVRAVTAWSAFGAYDWDSLLTRDVGHYESGLFDARAAAPRPTALAAMVRGLATEGHFAHPVLAAPGWWAREERLLYPPESRAAGELPPPDGRGCAGPGSAEAAAAVPAGLPAGLLAGVPPRLHDGAARPQAHHPFVAPVRASAPAERPLLVAGAGGVLGRTVARLCRARGLAVRALGRREMDIADPAAVAAVLDRLDPWGVVNAAGYVRVDDAEWERERCRRENTLGPAVLAALCADRGLALATVSSDLVFDGRKGAPYVEGDAATPINAYGESKAEGERLVLERHPAPLVARAGAFFGPWEELSFVTATLRDLAAGLPVPAADDAVISPSYLPDFVDALLDLLIDGAHGVWHLANAGALSWAELARLAARTARLDDSLVEGRATGDFAFLAARPLHTALASERAWLMPAVENAICRYVAARPLLRDGAYHALHQQHCSPPGEDADVGVLA